MRTGNSVGNEGARALSNALENNSTLTTLALSSTLWYGVYEEPLSGRRLYRMIVACFEQ